MNLARVACEYVDEQALKKMRRGNAMHAAPVAL